MEPNQLRVEAQRTSWNKGKMIGQKTPLKLKEIWLFAFGFRRAGDRENWLCSIWQSTANFVDAT